MASKVLDSLLSFLRQKVLDRNWSERELSRKSNLSAGTVNLVLSGQKDIRLSTIVALSEALEVPPFYLLMSAAERLQWDALKNVEPRTFDERLKRLENSLPKSTEEALSSAEQQAASLLEGMGLSLQKKKKQK